MKRIKFCFESGQFQGDRYAVYEFPDDVSDKEIEDVLNDWAANHSRECWKSFPATAHDIQRYGVENVGEFEE